MKRLYGLSRLVPYFLNLEAGPKMNRVMGADLLAEAALRAIGRRPVDLSCLFRLPEREGSQGTRCGADPASGTGVVDFYFGKKGDRILVRKKLLVVLTIDDYGI